MDKKFCEGIVVENLPGLKFKVQKENGVEVLAYISGKMSRNHIWINVGDKVEILIPEYGSIYRIVKRL